MCFLLNAKQYIPFTFFTAAKDLMKDRRKPCKSVSDEDIAKKTECPMDKCIFADKCYEKELPGILYLSHLTCNVKGILDDEESYQDLKRGFDYKYTFARSIIEKMS